MVARTLQEILADYGGRIQRLERRKIPRPRTPATPWAAWAAKSGAVSWQSAYVSVWSRGVGGGGSLDATSVTNGILILADGIYEVHAHQRGGSASDFIGIGMNGDRVTLENRATGVWTHDHASGANNFTNSYYLGPLLAGEKITAGSPTTGGGIVYGAAATSGALYVRRVS
jgi:hypothetical protein